MPNLPECVPSLPTINKYFWVTNRLFQAVFCVIVHATSATKQLLVVRKLPQNQNNTPQAFLPYKRSIWLLNAADSGF